ncbi:putative fatty acyl-CoA reductase CG5065, partial [Musca vetustissima]|uniref:putative fatty acyl-CoA reductase CG5065 n=1 Tax=Musca vetustissima TaxID=27455 RepID=UPI002AB710D5
MTCKLAYPDFGASNVLSRPFIKLTLNVPDGLSFIYNCVTNFIKIFVFSSYPFQVLVEKLLRSCPDIKNIYLLIRPKRGHEVSQRLNELLEAPLFEKLRREKPKDLSKVIPISGDITSEELGISESDQALLCRNVSIVFHSAATVKFDEKLKLSVTINMLGTKRLVELCHRMMSLDALIHVSTAYCNCDRTEVSEVIYAPPYNPDDIISLVNWLPEDTLDK